MEIYLTITCLYPSKRFVKPQFFFAEDTECLDILLYVLLKYFTKMSVQVRAAYTKGQFIRCYTSKTMHILLSYINIIAEAICQRVVELFWL